MRSRELRGEANLRLAAKPSSEPSERELGSPVCTAA